MVLRFVPHYAVKRQIVTTSMRGPKDTLMQKSVNCLCYFDLTIADECAPHFKAESLQNFIG